MISSGTNGLEEYFGRVHTIDAIQYKYNRRYIEKHDQ